MTIRSHQTAVRLLILIAACLFVFINGDFVHAQVTLNDRDREIKIKLPEGPAAIVLSDDGKLIAVQPGESLTPPEIRIFDVVTGERLTSIDGLAASDVMVAFLPDSKHIAAAKNFSKTAEELKIWDVRSQKLTRTISLPESAAGRSSRLTFSPDGRLLALLHSNGPSEKIIIREASTGKVETNFVLPFLFGPDAIMFSPDNAYLACSGSSSVAMWKLSNKKRILAVSNPRTFVGPIAFSRDSSQLIVEAAIGLLDDNKRRDSKSTLAYWNTSNGRQAKRVNLPTLMPGGILTPDELSVVYFSADEVAKFQQRDTVEQLDIRTKKLIGKVPIDEVHDIRNDRPDRNAGKAPKLYISRNGETLALRYGDSIRLWRRTPAKPRDEPE